MLRGKLLLLETFPPDLPQHIVCVPSTVSNYSLGGGFGFYLTVHWHVSLSFLTEFKNGSDTALLWGLLWHILRSSQQGWTRIEPTGVASAHKWKASKTTCHLLYWILPFLCSCSPKYPEYSSPFWSSRLSNEPGPQRVSNISAARRRTLSSSVLFGTETTLSWFCGPFISFHTSAGRFEVTNEPSSCWAVPATAAVSLSRVTRGRGWLGCSVLADLFTTCL